MNFLPQMVIKDEDEVLFYRVKVREHLAEDDMALWTNCKLFVQAFVAVFEEFWHNSTDIHMKITERQALCTHSLF